jgi:hypothetical protein
MSILVQQVVKTVEERARPSAAPPATQPQAQAAPEFSLQSDQVLQLARREQREQAFRLGR